ncbi:AAA family ATPase [Caenimonas soli]|uniref:AAA family ATPase n=1 Tax=Caenimonas soli TaxID=2735555 RepID=UPI001557EF2F|nr:AAA family ATPase [Caenimonas soli]NPC59306.1 AAA family ATPase [Caenimonas soli]
MLERIADIQGIGLFHQANGKPYSCQRATLIYADNGRGKSTLATILRSVATADPSLISASKTIDGTMPPKVVLQFGSGHKVTFDAGTWSEKRPELLVFDAEFIGRNVHSGGAVSTDHRKNLLEFALGEAAVSARTAVDSAALAAKAASDQVNSLVGQLSGHHTGMMLAQFEQLPAETEIDAKLVDWSKRAVAATNVAAIQAKQIPATIAEPTFDLDLLFDSLARSLKDVHADAERIVKEHIFKLGEKEAEGWLSQGRQFTNGRSCPFCDQDISRNELVSAYQTHFNAAYAALKTTVAALQEEIKTGLTGLADGVSKSTDVAAAQALAWAEHVETGVITFELIKAETSLKELADLLLDLALRKENAPLDAIGDAKDRAKASDLWLQFLAPVRATNVSITLTAKRIQEYKTQLVGENAIQLQQQIARLHAIKRRYAPDVVNLLAQLATGRTAASNAETAKKAARATLDSLMTATLGKYQVSINGLLKKFGASFSIRGMSANFRGNAPRSEYGLLLRGKEIPLEGGPPSFATALSEGDKRTLAFAFFIASSLEDPKLNSRIVVIDDPMCSLDLNRRHHTRTVLRQIHSKAAQLIVLAHDPFFLRDLRDALKKEDNSAAVSVFQLTAAPHNYTDFAALDIDRECESDYARHHRLLNDFSMGTGGDARVVAKAIRPMLEGYLHRRFPGLLPKDLMFGGVVIRIRDSVAPSPLAHAVNLIDALNEVNEYAGQFHHDTNPDADTVVISASELKGFVDDALCIVHKGAPA